MSAGKILVVDDDPQIRRVMKATLVGHGYEVLEARTGEEALEKMPGEMPNLVLLDMQPAGHADRQVHPPLSGALRQCESDGDLVGCELRGKLPGRVPVQLRIIHDAPAAPEFGDRGQFLRLGP